MAAITPAATNVGRVRAYCGRLENFDRAALLRMGLDGSGFAPNATETALGITAGSIAVQALDLALDGYTTFDFQVVAETNDAVTINLTTLLGIDFLTVGTYRKVEFETFANADADVGCVKRTAIVQGAATPIVIQTAVTSVADIGLATIETALTRQVAAGDLLASAAVVPFCSLAQSSNALVLTYTGISNIDTNATVRIYVYPLETQALFVTD